MLLILWIDALIDERLCRCSCSGVWGSAQLSKTLRLSSCQAKFLSFELRIFLISFGFWKSIRNGFYFLICLFDRHGWSHGGLVALFSGNWFAFLRLNRPRTRLDTFGCLISAAHTSSIWLAGYRVSLRLRCCRSFLFKTAGRFDIGGSKFCWPVVGWVFGIATATPIRRKVWIKENRYLFRSFESFANHINFKHFQIIVRFCACIETSARRMNLSLIQVVHNISVPFKSILQHFENHFKSFSQLSMKVIKVAPRMIF